MAVLVPTHKLSNELVKIYAEYGLSAKVWRGRSAGDPDHPDYDPEHPDKTPMCDDLAAVTTRPRSGSPSETVCCKAKTRRASGLNPSPGRAHRHRPRLRPSCAYQTEKRPAARRLDRRHDMLFRPQKLLKDVAAVAIDEGFFKTRDPRPHFVSLDEFRRIPDDPDRPEDNAELAQLRQD